MIRSVDCDSCNQLERNDFAGVKGSSGVLGSGVLVKILEFFPSAQCELVCKLFKQAIITIKEMVGRKLKTDKVFELLFEKYELLFEKDELKEFGFDRLFCNMLLEKTNMILNKSPISLRKKMDKKFGKYSLSEKRIKEIFYYNSFSQFFVLLNYINVTLYQVRNRDKMKCINYDYSFCGVSKDFSMFNNVEKITRESLDQFLQKNLNIFLQKNELDLLQNSLKILPLEDIREIFSTNKRNSLKKNQTKYITKTINFNYQNEGKDDFCNNFFFPPMYKFFQTFYTRLLEDKKIKEDVFYRITNNVLFDILDTLNPRILKLYKEREQRFYKMQSKLHQEIQQKNNKKKKKIKLKLREEIEKIKPPLENKKKFEIIKLYREIRSRLNEELSMETVELVEIIKKLRKQKEGFLKLFKGEGNKQKYKIQKAEKILKLYEEMGKNLILYLKIFW